MQSHGISTEVLLSATEFSYLCPALINQIDGKYCIVHASSEKAETPPKGYSLQIGRLFFFNVEQKPALKPMCYKFQKCISKLKEADGFLSALLITCGHKFLWPAACCYPIR